MWPSPRRTRLQQCTMEQLHPCVGAPHHPDGKVLGRVCTTPPHVRRVHLQFPPPPNYPPPYPSTSKMSSEEHLLATPGPSTQPLDHWGMPNDYSYAYYVPGPPTRHTNVPSKYPGTYREGSYRARHTYLTRYGTEENIYEEISEMARARLKSTKHQVGLSKSSK